VSSYTPTLTALVRAQARGELPGEPKLATIAVEKSAQPLAQLTYVRQEAALVEDMARHSGIPIVAASASDATMAEATDAFGSAQFVHIACHGIQDPEQPLESAFCLNDGNLTVSQLMDIDLKDAFFAFLSACETAKGDAEQPDQAIHLAAATLFLGFRSVVATMW
jgi:CHAT domain-containing protein